MQPKAARNIAIEALRLIAVAGIAVFHTFQWTFQTTCAGLPEYVPLAAFPHSGALGFINLLGCWANEVFFMISGYFLIASAERAWDGGATWKSQMQRTAQRLGKVILPRGARVVHGRLTHSRCYPQYALLVHARP